MSDIHLDGGVSQDADGSWRAVCSFSNMTQDQAVHTSQWLRGIVLAYLHELIEGDSPIKQRPHINGYGPRS